MASLIGAVVLIVSIGVVAAATLLSQNAPAIPTTSILMTSQCGSALKVNPAFGADRIFVGQTGVTGFDCGPQNSIFTGLRNSAFHTDSGGPAIPSFNLSNGYTALYVQRTGNFGSLNCNDFAGTETFLLTSGSRVNAAGGGLDPGADYSYCAQYQNVPSGGLAGFTVTWTDS